MREGGRRIQPFAPVINDAFFGPARPFSLVVLASSPGGATPRGNLKAFVSTQPTAPRSSPRLLHQDSFWALKSSSPPSPCSLPSLLHPVIYPSLFTLREKIMLTSLDQLLRCCQETNSNSASLSEISNKKKKKQKKQKAKERKMSLHAARRCSVQHQR